MRFRAFAQYSGHGTNPKRQEGPHAHSIDLSPDNRFAIVDDLGLDETLVYKFDSVGGLLAPDPNARQGRSRSRPQALRVSSQRQVCLCDQRNEIHGTRLVRGRDRGFASAANHFNSSLDSSRNNGAAEIEVHPSGKFLYASNRGHDSIAVFAVDGKKGTLTLVEYVSTKGQSPRNFAIAPGGKLLFTADEKSDKMVVFRIDPRTGRLTPTGKDLDVSQPVCVKFVPVE